MIFAIKAYEDTYYGMGGKNYKIITECLNLNEAKEIAEEESTNIIFNDNRIINDIEFTAYSLSISDNIEYDRVFNMLVKDLIRYDIYIIPDTCPLSIERLNSMDFYDVINLYAEDGSNPFYHHCPF